MKVTDITTLQCDGGWRPWTFVKVTTDEGLVGYAECTNSQYSPWAVNGAIRDLAPVVLGRDPAAWDTLRWDLYRATRQSRGGIAQKAVAGIENALLDLRAKSLGMRVCELFGGPYRERVRTYWSHCGTARATAHELVGEPPVRCLEDVAGLGREVVKRGFSALKTNILLLGDQPEVVRPGFAGPIEGTSEALDRDVLRAAESLVGTFRDAVGPDVDIAVDVNFNFRTDGAIRLARALEPFDLMWLEIDSHDRRLLADVRAAASFPIASGECLYALHDYEPYVREHAMDVAVVDVCWNGLATSKLVADYACLHELNVAPHNYYSHLATCISAQFCAAVPNAAILEVDVDDVPWKDDLVTAVPTIADGELVLPDGPGWGVDLVEEAVAEHPWPRPGTPPTFRHGP
jgi:galactonate dehydratase